MAGWFIPALKAVLPHVGDIVAAAKPVFTRKPAQDGSTGGGMGNAGRLVTPRSYRAPLVRTSFDSR